MIDELSNALSILVLTTIEPYVAPIIKTATEGLNAGSERMLKGEDQTEAFNNPDCSEYATCRQMSASHADCVLTNPTHSVLSKDHFDLWLKEPARLAAIAVVQHTVPLVVEAWYDENADVGHTIDAILEAIHHPCFTLGNSSIQEDMLDTVRQWISGMDSQMRNKVLQSLNKYGRISQEGHGGTRHGRNNGDDEDASPRFEGMSLGLGSEDHQHGNEREGGEPYRDDYCTKVPVCASGLQLMFAALPSAKIRS